MADTLNLNNNNNFIESLISASSDAQGNLYEVSFTGGNLTDENNSLKIRVDNFTPPETSQKNYQVKYLTASIDRPAAQVTTAKNFSLDFRVDANYNAYKALLKQQKLTFNPSHNFAAIDINSLAESNKLFSVTVNAVNEGVTTEEVETTTLFKFDRCWITSIAPLSFKVGSSDPITVSITINFLGMTDLQTSL